VKLQSSHQRVVGSRVQVNVLLPGHLSNLHGKETGTGDFCSMNVKRYAQTQGPVLTRRRRLAARPSQQPEVDRGGQWAMQQCLSASCVANHDDLGVNLQPSQLPAHGQLNKV
jgi:hypothetical protein